jgi:DNA-binding NarL/FixJ family response regulator
MNDSVISILLVAGNRLLREALTMLFHKRGDFRVCGGLVCQSDVSSAVAESGAQVALLDSVSVQISHFEIISDIHRSAPDTKVVLIDMDDDADTFLECVRAGAVGYLLKDASATDVVAGVRAVARGQALCPPQLNIHLFRAVLQPWTPFSTMRVRVELGLTRRQQQILPLVAQGLTNKEIASRFHLSEQTVKNHVHRMLRRVGANDRLAMVDLARHGTFSMKGGAQF